MQNILKTIHWRPERFDLKINIRIFAQCQVVSAILLRFFFREKEWGFENGSFYSFFFFLSKCQLLWYISRNSVITDFNISNISTSIKNKHNFWKLVPIEMKCENEKVVPQKWIFHHLRLDWDHSKQSWISQVLCSPRIQIKELGSLEPLIN
jgi:hypothetical protein